jgi:transcriptional regulator of arginine metabolism
MDKYYRRNQILELVLRDRIPTQGELREKLAQRGIRVTQATVSRDLEQLGLAKTRQGYVVPQGNDQVRKSQPEVSLLLKEFLRDAKLAGNIVVVKTHPGNAHTVAEALDRQQWPEVVGTVAGDDTIFVATHQPRDADKAHRRILGMVAR